MMIYTCMTKKLRVCSWSGPLKKGVLELKNDYVRVIHGPTEHSQGAM